MKRPKDAAGPFGVMFFFLSCAVLYPVWITPLPPLVDYPNHLARMHILAHADRDADLGKFYEPKWAVLPNLAMDGIVPWTLSGVSVYAAGRIFVALVLVMPVLGTACLHRVLHGKKSLWPLLGFLFVYNRLLLWGFLNYLLGLSLFLLVFSGWIHFRNKKAPFRILVFSLLSVVLFFSHLFALGLYFLSILGYEAAACRRQAGKDAFLRLLTAASQFLLPGVLLLFFSPTASGSSLQAFRYGGFLRKASALFQPLHNYSLPLDVLTAAGLTLVFAAGLWRKRISFHRDMLAPAVLMAVFFLFMPEMVLTVHGADTRIPAALVFLLVAATEVRPGSGREFRIAAAVVLAVFALRTAVVASQWKKSGSDYQRVIKAVDAMPRGSALYTLVASAGPWQPFPTPMAHIGCLAVIEKSAFVPTLFAYPTQQPLAFRPPFDAVSGRSGGSVRRTTQLPDWRFIEAHYDYVLLIDRMRLRPDLPEHWERVFGEHEIRLYRTGPLG